MYCSIQFLKFFFFLVLAREGRGLNFVTGASKISAQNSINNYFNDHTHQKFYVPAIPQVVSPGCDYLITSASSKTGQFTSEGYPNAYKDNVVCRYLIQGEKKERVVLTFDDLDLRIPIEKSDYVFDENFGCEDMDTVSLNSIFNNTSNRTIAKFCGKMKPPKSMSHDSRLEVIFVAVGRGGENDVFERQHTGFSRGFRATYAFVTDFGIKEGEQRPDLDCCFVYKSSLSKNGTISSPNYPGFYPRSTVCHYLFYGDDNEFVQIKFNTFEVKSIENECQHSEMSDYVEFSNFNIELQDRKMIKWCGRDQMIDRPVVSDGKFFRVSFHSNANFHFKGFQATYEFKKKEEPESSRPKKGKSRGAGLRYFNVIFFFSLLSLNLF